MTGKHHFKKSSFFLIGLACAFVYILWYILSLCYTKLYFISNFDSFLGLGLILTLIFYCIAFFVIGFLLCLTINNFSKKRYIWFIILGWILGTIFIFLDLTFGCVINVIIEPIFEWACAGVSIFYENTDVVINYRFRDDLPTMSFLAIILNCIFPVIICSTVWCIKVVKCK